MRLQRTEPAIPLRGYFLSVGGVLLALLLAADRLLPDPAPNPIMNHPFDHPAVRIHSDVKGPAAVVIDGPAARLAMLTAPAGTPAPLGPAFSGPEPNGAPAEPPPMSEPNEQDSVPLPLLGQHAASVGDSYAQLEAGSLATKALSRSKRIASSPHKRRLAKDQPRMSPQNQSLNQ
jgi:hypothetical protein